MTSSHATPSAPNADLCNSKQHLLSGLRNLKIVSDVLQKQTNADVSWGLVCIRGYGAVETIVQLQITRLLYLSAHFALVY